MCSRRRHRLVRRHLEPSERIVGIRPAGHYRQDWFRFQAQILVPVEDDAFGHENAESALDSTVTTMPLSRSIISNITAGSYRRYGRWAGSGTRTPMLLNDSYARRRTR